MMYVASAPASTSPVTRSLRTIAISIFQVA